MANFRLLHITDLHISIPPPEDSHGERAIYRSLEAVYPSRASIYALEAIAEFVFEHREQTDLVLISGDVADDGVQRNLDAAFRFVTAPASVDWRVIHEIGTLPTLDAQRTGGPPFFITPGNHDRFHGPGRVPGGNAFDKTFGSYWKSGLGGVQDVTLKKGDSVLTLVAADFCLQNLYSSRIYLGQGNAYERVVNALIERTASVKTVNPNGGIVWISHFPPLLNVDASLKLLGAQRLLVAAQQAGVRHIVAGHLHRNQVNTYADVDVICTGTAASTGTGELHGFWIQRLNIDVDPSGEVSIALDRFRYKQSELAFIQQR
jgi:3',5'-cyclic AMP phosphodiesterase CpdA